MINFSKVRRSILKEEPMVPDPKIPGMKRFVPPDKPVKKDNRNIEQRQQAAITGPNRPQNDRSQGGLGFWTEKVVKDMVLPRLKSGNYQHLDVGHPGSRFGVKTDIYDDQGDSSKNTAFSVKAKMDNDYPQKVHQTGVGSAGTFSKLKLQNANRMAREAMNMYLGESGEFTTAGDMDAEHKQALIDHLTQHKKEIFNALVRQQGNPAFGEPYQNHDPRMIDKLVSHRVTGPHNSGNIDIRPLQGKVTDDNFENLNWMDDGKRFYLGDEENAPTDKRMIDLWPIDEEGSRWSNREGDGGPRPGQRGHRPGLREAGLPEPGQFKATMATNPEFLDKYFPKEKEFYLDDDGTSLDLREPNN